MTITITTDNEKFGDGVSNYAVESLLNHIAHEIGKGPIREFSRIEGPVVNNGGEVIGSYTINL